VKGEGSAKEIIMAIRSFRLLRVDRGRLGDHWQCITRGDSGPYPLFKMVGGCVCRGLGGGGGGGGGVGGGGGGGGGVLGHELPVA